MADFEIVETGSVEVFITVRKWDEGSFDWILSNGEESSETFATARDALNDAESFFG
jgi:hypothetical protein